MEDGGHHGFSTTVLSHQQQELASLLATVFPGGGATETGGAIVDEGARLTALVSVHRMILRPHAAVNLRRSSIRICQSLHQVLFDKSYAVRQAAAVAYGAWGAVAPVVNTSSNVRAVAGLSGGPSDQFMGWALSQLTNSNFDNDAGVIALMGLKEFLHVGDPVALERFASPILRACQSLLEDAGTSMTLLRPLLGVLVVLGLKFSWCVQPHFADMVDMLLGWALESDVSEGDSRIITDSFVQFQSLWVGSLSFSLNLLTKFLDDMEVLAQDFTPTTRQESRRLMALAFCYVAVLEAVTTGVSESDKVELMTTASFEMLPRLITCLMTVGRKFGDLNWSVVASRCMTLFSEFLKEEFARYYSLALHVLFQNIEPELFSGDLQHGSSGQVTSSAGVAVQAQQVHSLLLANLQLLSAQGHALPVSAVHSLLKWDSTFSNLRLHPNYLVTRIIATTYMFLLQHGSEIVALEASKCLTEELDGFKLSLSQAIVRNCESSGKLFNTRISEAESTALFKFNLLALVGSICMKNTVTVTPNEQKRPSLQTDQQLTRASEVKRYILDKLLPFTDPVQWYPNLQVAVVQALYRLCSLIMSIKMSRPNLLENVLLGMDLLNDYLVVIVPSLESYASLPLILAVLKWISHWCEAVTSQPQQPSCLGSNEIPGRGLVTTSLNSSLLYALLSAASHREPSVRGRVAAVLEQLLRAKIVAPAQLPAVAVVALEQLGDPEPHLQSAFRRLLVACAPAALWIVGWIDFDQGAASQESWKCMCLGRQSADHLRPQQLVTILKYISQRSQSLPSNWLQRLVHNCPAKSRSGTVNEEGERSFRLDINTYDSTAEYSADDAGIAGDFLTRACNSNNIAAGWWAIQIAARHFVTVRLRTHLGGPTQTFAVLERMLVDAAQLFQMDSRQGGGSNTIISPGAQLLPTRLLLEFMGFLEKNIYNAYEGSVVLAHAPVASALFFRANKKVCEEWFVRIRDALMNLSVAIQSHTGTFYHASLRLQDLSILASRESARSQSSDGQPPLDLKLQQDLYRVLRHLSLALCRARKMELLSGLQTWTITTFGVLLAEDSSASQKGVGPLSWISGLRLQAQGQYEKAVAHYSHLLQSEEALGAMGAEGVQFTIARTIESYVALSDWESLDSWLQDLQVLRAKHAGKQYSGALTTAGNDMNAIHALVCFDAGDVSGAWGYLDLTPQSNNELTADPRQAIQRSEQMLLQAMLRPENTEDAMRDLATAKAMLDGVLPVIALDSLPDAAPFVIQLECIRVFEAAGKLQSDEDEQPLGRKPESPPSSALWQVLQWPLDVYRQDCHSWLKLFRVYHAVQPHSLRTLELQQHLVRLARKQHNLKLARRLLLQAPGKEILGSTTGSEGTSHRGFKYQEILLNYAEDNHVDAIVALWDFVRGCMSRGPSAGSIESENILNAKACLKLSSWLKHEASQLSLASLFSRLSIDQSLGYNTKASIPEDEDLAGRTTDRYTNDVSSSILLEIVGAGPKAATVRCPEMAKAWFLYGTWCYDQAKAFLMGKSPIHKSVIFPQLLESELDCSEINLTTASVLNIVSDAISSKGSSKSEGGDKKYGYSAHVDMDGKGATRDAQDAQDAQDAFVQHLVFVMQNALKSEGIEDSDAEPPAKWLSVRLHQELQTLRVFSGSFEVTTLVDQLMGVWWDLRRKRLALFGHAAHGFLHYLSMSNSKQAHLHYSSSDRIKQKRTDGVLSASLFVLRILLNYGVELEETLALGLSSVPPSPWQVLTAQLFARLSSHPEAKVRKQLEDLLISLAHVSPWAIVYPTLVDINASGGRPSGELHRILNCLVRLHPKLVKDVKVMIKELAGITVLWDEQWLSTLQDLHGDVMRRIATLKDEAARVADNPTLSHPEKLRINAAKYSAIMAPVAVALERRLTSTSRHPETPHEVWFQKQFGCQLKAAISNFKSRPKGTTSLGDTWRTLDEIAASFGHQKKLCSLLNDISPQLAAFRSSEAPMPGLEVQTMRLEQGASDHCSSMGSMKESQAGSGMVTITGFDDQVTILATKTKPKKISMVGSDGERYTYLLKGREDLRLDARIMQILHAVNGMLRAKNTTRERGLAVRYYSVTPISGQAGLIQWVSNLTSMYSVFKAWQQREQTAQQGAGVGLDLASRLPVPRPSDLFYGKIIPALKEKGLRKVISRKDWPQEVKRKVLLELMKETPRQLLHLELWCASVGLHTFTSKQERFSGSVAVMSMVGYVLGLGDRHLDNILVDFNTGDVMHIDYNVCFDKGLRLKIPEIVPFRLTQTIQAALGVFGVEGLFRANCKMVLKVLHDHKDLILMLLEVFIWDPLVEWMRGDDHDEATIGGEERKGMELAVSLSLFSSRVQEIRVPLQEHHDQLLTTLPAMSEALQSLTDARVRYEKAFSAMGPLEQDRLIASRTEAAARPLILESSIAFEKARAGHEKQIHELGQLKGQLTEAAVEMTKSVDRYGRVLNTLRNGSASELQGVGQFSTDADGLSLTAAILSGGLPLTIVPEAAQIHCRDIDRELTQLMTAHHEALLQGSKALQAYSMALQRLLPVNYVASSDGHTWAQILQVLVRKLSPDALGAARRQAVEFIARQRGEHDDTIRQKYEALRIHIEQLWKEVHMLQAEFSELEASMDVEAERKAKDRLLTMLPQHFMLNGKPKEDDFLSTVGNQSRPEDETGVDLGRSLENDEKRAKVIFVLHAVAILFSKVSERVGSATSERKESCSVAWRWCLPELQKEVERWVLLSELLTELYRLGIPVTEGLMQVAEWAQIFRAFMIGVEDLRNQLGGLVLPEAIKASLSHDPAVLEAFSALSRVRLSVDSTLEQIAVIEAQRSSVSSLEKSYHVRVGQISKRQAELKENATKSREHLSWEEAEELASEEEACRALLEELQRAWTQRGSQASAIARGEMNVEAALVNAEQRFDSLVGLDPDGDLHLMRGKVLLAALARVFSALEPWDRRLTSVAQESYLNGDRVFQSEFLCVGYPRFNFFWKASDVSFNKVFFAWKVRVIDTLLNSCITTASGEDLKTGLDRSMNHKKQRLERELQELLDSYLRERVVPVLLNCLSRQTQMLRLPSVEEYSQLQMKEEEAVKRVLRLIHEYCDAHETVRSLNSAISITKSRENDLMQALQKVHMEAAQMEWLYDRALALVASESQLLGLPSSLFGECCETTITWWSRQQVLENLESSVAIVTRANDNLQISEVAGRSGEEQLDRAMAWACAVPANSSAVNGNSNRSTGIPSEFHEHLLRRRQLLCSAQEQAAGIIRLCAAVLEFEGSRGILSSAFQKETLLWRYSSEDSTRQKTYENLISKLEVACLAFTNSELKLQEAQKESEGVGAHLQKAKEDLHTTARDVESASSELQEINTELQDRTVNAAAAVSAFCRAMRVHSALTLEGGTMIEEVLAITNGAEGVDDVRSLAQQASVEHKQLMGDLTKIHLVLLPMEAALLSAAPTSGERFSGGEQDVDTFVGGKDQGQAVLQALVKVTREAVSIVTDTVPRLIVYVKRLHLSLTKLARTASSDAGVLHKALEGLGESQEARSQEVTAVGSNFVMKGVALPEVQTGRFVKPGDGATRIVSQSSHVYLQTDEDESMSPQGDTLDPELYNPNKRDSFQVQFEGSGPSPASNVQKASAGETNVNKSTKFFGAGDEPSTASIEENPEVLIMDMQGAATEKNVNESIMVFGAGVEPNTASLEENSQVLILGIPDTAGEKYGTHTGVKASQGGGLVRDARSDANGLGGSVENLRSGTATTSSQRTDGRANSACCVERQASSVINYFKQDQTTRTKEKNAYALSVMNRVKGKLEGRDVVGSRHVAVAEHVDELLQQATSLDNLCNMYEGWTPWI